MTKKIFVLAFVAALLAATAAAYTAVRVRRQKSDAASGNAESSAREDAKAARDSGAGSRESGAKRARAPVVVELFTSEGCSSCPPADALLTKMDETQPVEGAEVIALAQHVDYWNHLGWSDPFSAREFSERQDEYARAFGMGGVYTPQMVVDGRAEFNGGDRGKAVEAIERAAREPKAEVTLARAEPRLGETDTLRLTVRVEKAPKPTDGETADLLLFITESGLSSDVSRGENAGRRLGHVGVVRRMTKIGGLGEGTYTVETTAELDKSWRRENLRAVVVLQERTGKRVVGAASLKL